MAKPKVTEQEILHILRLHTGKLRLCIRGTSPFIFNAMSEKAKHGLVCPPRKMNAVEKAGNQKHQPIEEYRESVYQHRDDDRPTRLMFPAGAFKKAAMTAALEIPGAKRSVVGRLLWIESSDIDLYGVPQLLMSVVRCADMNRTPDIRTRAILPQWACALNIRFVQPQLDHTQVANLIAAAGLVAGVGDFRQEKGAGNFGQFEVVSEDDPEYRAILKHGARAAQDRALAEPALYDLETEKLFGWFNEEMTRRHKNLNGAPAAEA